MLRRNNSNRSNVSIQSQKKYPFVIWLNRMFVNRNRIDNTILSTANFSQSSAVRAKQLYIENFMVETRCCFSFSCGQVGPVLLRTSWYSVWTTSQHWFLCTVLLWASNPVTIQFMKLCLVKLFHAIFFSEKFLHNVCTEKRKMGVSVRIQCVHHWATRPICKIVVWV